MDCPLKDESDLQSSGRVNRSTPPYRPHLHQASTETIKKKYSETSKIDGESPIVRHNLRLPPIVINLKDDHSSSESDTPSNYISWGGRRSPSEGNRSSIYSSSTSIPRGFPSQISVNAEHAPSHNPRQDNEFFARLQYNPCAPRHRGLGQWGSSVYQDWRQREWCPTVLVLGPGGMKGFLELGALTRLEERGILKNVNSYLGVSVGALISLLRIIGYTYREIAGIGSDLNLFNGWDDINFSEILRHNGIIGHDKLKSFLTKIVTSKLGIVPSFEQLFVMTNKVLRVVSYNLTAGTTCYFDYRTHPTRSVVDATMASCNIPLIFYKLKYLGDYYCDGAIGNPYPIDKVDDGATDILGIYIKSVPDLENQDDIAWYFDKVVHATMVEYRKHIIKNSSDRCKHLGLASDIKDVTGLAVDNKARTEMFRAGYREADKFLNASGDIIVMEPRANNPVPYVPTTTMLQSNGPQTLNPSYPNGYIHPHPFFARNANTPYSIPPHELNGISNRDNESDDANHLTDGDLDVITDVIKQAFADPSILGNQSSNDMSTELNGIKLAVENILQTMAINDIEKRVVSKLVPSIVSEVVKRWEPRHVSSDGSDPGLESNQVVRRRVCSYIPTEPPGALVDVFNDVTIQDLISPDNTLPVATSPHQTVPELFSVI